MADPVAVAAVGVGRIGVFHARHVQEVARETGTCRLVAVVDRHADTAKRVAGELSDGLDEVLAFGSPEALAEANVADGAVVASRTIDHRRDTAALVEAGIRVLLEKPLGDSLAEAREFGAWLDGEERRSQAVMMAFQRRYDAPLLRAKALLDGGAIGTLFKVVSVLEDPEPPPPPSSPVLPRCRPRRSRCPPCWKRRGDPESRRRGCRGRSGARRGGVSRGGSGRSKGCARFAGPESSAGHSKPHRDDTGLLLPQPFGTFCETAWRFFVFWNVRVYNQYPRVEKHFP